MRTFLTRPPHLPNAKSAFLASTVATHLLLFCMLFCGTIGLPNQAYTQQPPIRLCTPDCADDGWWPGSPDIIIPVPNNPDCKITVKWWYRSNRCTNPWTFDIQVVSASYAVTEGCPPFALPFSEVLRIAYEEIIRNGYKYHDDIFESLEEGECYDSYRIVQANCWRTDFVPVFGWSACENNPAGCCMQRYRICKINGQRKIYRLGSGGLNNTPFPPCQNDFDNAHCENMCQVLAVVGDGDEGPPPGGGGQGSKRQTDPLSSKADQSVSTSTAIPNPASESVAISFATQQPGEAIIRLYDGIGREIIKATSTIEKTGQTTVNLDIRSVKDGVYRYDITREHSVVASGSFVVLKK